MARDFARSFYNSAEWHSCKEAYLAKVGRLCERCLLQGMIVPANVVHHKVHLTSSNITDPSVTLNHDNLMALCTDCHAEVHKKQKRWRVDEEGNVIPSTEDS